MNKKLLIIIIGAITALGAIGGVAVPKMLSGKHKAPVKVAKKYTAVPLDEFLVNLADGGDPHYLKAVVVMEVGEDPKLDDKIKEATPKIRDAMIVTMTKRTFHELLTTGGKQDLREALKADGNRALGPGMVNEVYFTSFAMQ
ncbi:MAG TPA: flagellar basal body-associated FliL family protein [Armatimonadota bacterium]|jgi:flagellar FliL protein